MKNRLKSCRLGNIVRDVVLTSGWCGGLVRSVPLILVVALAGGPAHAKIELRLGTNAPIGIPADIAIKKVAQVVQERSGGEIVIKVYPAGQLGNEPQLIEAVQLGMVDMVMSAGSTFGNVLPEANILGLLYAFRDKDHMQAAMRGEPGQKLGKMLFDKTSIHILDAAWLHGTRQLSTNVPINHPDDLKGLKIRVVPVPIFEAGWKMMGATPTPVDGKELFLALQTKMADGQENPLPDAKSWGVPLVNKYFSFTSHIVSSRVTAISDEAYKRMTPEQIALIVSVLREVGAEQDAMIEDQERSLIKEFETEHRVTFLHPDKTPFRERVRTLAAEWNGGVLAEIYNDIQMVK